MDLAYSLTSLTIQPELVVKCLITGDDTNEIIRNATVLACTAKVYDDMVDGKLFFTSLIKLIDPNSDQFFALLNKEPTPFKKRYFQLRKNVFFRQQSIPGLIFNAAYAYKGAAQLLSFGDGISTSFEPKCDLKTKFTIEIPPGMQIPRMVKGASFFSAYSENFFVLNSSKSSIIYVFNIETKEYLTQYETQGEIYQLTIKDHILYVTEKYLDNQCNLVMFDLNLLEKANPITTMLPQDENPFYAPKKICLGEKYLIYMRRVNIANQLCALSLDCLVNPAGENKASTFVERDTTEGQRYLFSKENHFIEVLVNCSRDCDISRIDITSDGFLKTKIVKNIIFPGGRDNYFTDVAFHCDRVFFACEKFSCDETNIFFYDIKLKFKQASILYVKAETGNQHPFKPQFLSTPINVYYLMMTRKDTKAELVDPNNIDTHCLTFTVSKA